MDIHRTWKRGEDSVYQKVDKRQITAVKGFLPGPYINCIALLQNQALTLAKNHPPRALLTLHTLDPFIGLPGRHTCSHTCTSTKDNSSKAASGMHEQASTCVHANTHTGTHVSTPVHTNRHACGHT
eukprot:1138326-Pelagomonas_calceolata.AAC.2